MYLLAGDILLVRSPSWLSQRIRDFERGPGEDASDASHVGVVTVGGELDEAVIVEALSKVERHRLIDAYGGGDAEVMIARFTDLSVPELATIAAKAEGYVGCKYGYGKIVAHFADWALSYPTSLFGVRNPYVFRRLAGLDRYPICSWVVAQAYAVVGRTFGCPPGAADPDDVGDYVAAHLDTTAVIILDWAKLPAPIK